MAGHPLNPQQIRAVEHASGPLIVLAGPGTGKTRVIVHRIAHLIRHRGIRPEQVVAATFTVKAAEELRSRLAELVTPAVAQRVRAGTLHSLGAQVVRRHADRLGLPSRMSMIDAAQSRRTLRGVIEDLGLFRASRAEGLAALCDRQLSLFDALADRAVLPAAAVTHAEAMARHAADGAARALADDFSDAARAYGEYCRRRWERGRLSFADFVLLPVLGMSRDASLRAMLRSEAGAFVVDEFQDCNAGQIELLRLLAGGEGRAEGGADICAVGDDDQAIYAFRGADERAFERFARTWPGTTVLELSENYRSVRAIVGAANSVIVRAGESRFKPDKQINAARADPAVPHGVTIVTLDQEHEDAEAIAAMILMERAGDRSGGRTPASAAVVARTHGDLDRIAAVLTLEGIPWSRRREVSMLDDDGVRDVLAWAEWILHPGATWAARRVLARPPYQVDPRVLADWEREHRALVVRAHLAEDPSPTPAFHEWVAQRAASSQDAQVQAAGRAVGAYVGLRGALAGRRGDEAVDMIVRAIGTAHVELLPGRERARRISGLVSLLRLAREKQRDLDPPGDLGAFWSYLTDLRDADPTLRDVGGAEVLDADEELDREERGTASEQSGEHVPDSARVQLLTAHGAKGLEFDTVYVPRVRPPFGYPKSRVEEPDWEIPQGLVDQLDTRDPKTRKLDEERRLFYVACTRAKTRLVLLGAHKGRPSSAAVHFLDEFLFDAPAVEFSRTTARDVLRDASALGLGVLARTALEAAGLAFHHRQGAGEQIAEVVRQARLSAAHALERAARADLSPDELEACFAELMRSARTVGVASRADAPGWLTGGDALVEQAAERVARARAGDGAPSSALRLKPPPSPLSLSYTSVHEYGRCPLCWYMRFVLRLPGPESDEARTGTVVHTALDRFVKAWTQADSEGTAHPGQQDLLRLGRRAMIDELGRGASVHQEDMATVEAQLRSYFERFHDPGSQTIETERSIDFPYEVDGTAHRFLAKIDRVDLMADGGYRVIDYKTGKGWASLREPKKDDLQLGVYALAMRHAHEERDVLRGTAEYWLLATGERGVLPLADVQEKKVRAKIDSVVRGILAGDFRAEPGCQGPCALFG